MKSIIALDPGSDKCGYAHMNYDLTVREKGIVFLGELHRKIRSLAALLPEVIVIGKGTASKVVKDLVVDLDLKIDIRFGDEEKTTFEARTRYFRDHPPTGIWRLVPLSFQFPPRPVDDYAAVIIGERYISSNRLFEK